MLKAYAGRPPGQYHAVGIHRSFFLPSCLWSLYVVSSHRVQTDILGVAFGAHVTVCFAWWVCVCWMCEYVFSLHIPRVSLRSLWASADEVAGLSLGLRRAVEVSGR